MQQPYNFKSFLVLFVQHYRLHESVQQMSDRQILNVLRDKNEVVSKALSELMMAETAADFIKKDYELRTKVPDIWQMQLDKAKTEIESVSRQLENMASGEGIRLE